MTPNPHPALGDSDVIEQPDDLVATLRQWVIALRTPKIAETAVSDIALLNGGCVSDDIEDAVKEIERLRGLLKLSEGSCDAQKMWRALTEIEHHSTDKNAAALGYDVKLFELALIARAITSREGPSQWA